MAKLIAVAAAALASLSAGGSWVVVETQAFELYTDLDQGTAERIATRVNALLPVLQQAISADSVPGQARVFVFRRSADFEYHRPPEVITPAGYFQSGGNRDIITLADKGPETVRIILHEYTHLLLYRTGRTLPLWLNEGLAELGSTVELSGLSGSWGRPLPTHSKLLLERGLVAPDYVFGEQYRREMPKVDPGAFYAHSWALTHMLRLSADYSIGFVPFLDLLSNGASSEEAFARVYRQTPDQIQAALKTYIAGPAHFAPVGEKPFEPESGRLKTSSLMPLNRDAALFELLDTGRQKAKARLLYDRLRRETGSPAEAQAVLGDLALAQNLREEARNFYEKAVAAGIRDAAVHVELARLREEAGDDSGSNAMLRKASDLSSDIPAVHEILGNRALDQRRYTEAVRHLSRAAENNPHRATLLVSLALAFQRNGDPEKAASIATEAVRVSTDERERQMAEALLAGIEKPFTPAPSLPDAGAVHAPKWSNPKGDSRFSGDLFRVDCDGNHARLHVRSAGKVRTFEVLNPDKVELRNAGSVKRDLQCGAQQPLPVEVEYLDSRSEVTALEFR